MPRYYPVNLDVRGKTCLVVGGGEVALRKARALVDAGADVTVVAPEVHGKLKADERIELRERAFRTSDLHDAFIVIVATDDDLTNRSVASDAADFVRTSQTYWQVRRLERAVLVAAKKLNLKQQALTDAAAAGPPKRNGSTA